MSAFFDFLHSNQNKGEMANQVNKIESKAIIEQFMEQRRPTPEQMQPRRTSIVQSLEFYD